jgi:rubrerythrin
MQSSPPRDLAHLLELCARLEQAHARLYGALAEAHAASPRVAALWAKTAREEEGHAAQFRLAATRYLDRIVAVRVDPSEAIRLLEGVTALTERARQSPPIITEALRQAIQLEELMAALHLDRAADFLKPADRSLFRAMMAADQAHAQALRDALRELEGGAPRPATAISSLPRGRS